MISDYKMVNTVGELVMSWKNGISSCPLCRYWKKILKEKTVQKFISPFVW